MGGIEQQPNADGRPPLLFDQRTRLVFDDQTSLDRPLLHGHRRLQDDEGRPRRQGRWADGGGGVLAPMFGQQMARPLEFLPDRVEHGRHRRNSHRQLRPQQAIEQLKIGQILLKIAAQILGRIVRP